MELGLIELLEKSLPPQEIIKRLDELNESCIIDNQINPFKVEELCEIASNLCEEGYNVDVYLHCVEVYNLIIKKGLLRYKEKAEIPIAV